jgi:chaperonin cofactor prefoldin
MQNVLSKALAELEQAKENIETSIALIKGHQKKIEENCVRENKDGKCGEWNWIA